MSQCRCERCRRVVTKRGGSTRAKLVFFTAWLTLIPWVAFLSFSGGAAFVIAPIVMLLGCSILGAFRGDAFPEPLCDACGATLVHAPTVSDQELAPRRRPVLARARALWA